MNQDTIAEALGVELNGTATTDTTNTTTDTDTSTESSASVSQPGTATEDPNTDPVDSTVSETNINNNAQQHKPPQSADENARYAAARRQAESQRDKAIAKERERFAAETDKLIESLGMSNPYTGQPIKTKSELDAYNGMRSGETKRNFMESAGLNEEQYQQMVRSLPEVQEAMRARADAEASAKEYRIAKAKNAIESQIAEITKIDPEIKSIENLLDMENYDDFYALVKKGNSLVDAYKLANYDNLIDKATSAEKQRTLNAAAGKSHLSGAVASSRATGIDPVPVGKLSYYRVMFPDLSDDEIAREYAKIKKK